MVDVLICHFVAVDKDIQSHAKVWHHVSHFYIFKENTLKFDALWQTNSIF